MTTPSKAHEYPLDHAPDSNGRNLIFLISLPRSGSTMMQRILGGHPDIHTTSEPWLMLHPFYALKHSGIETEYSSDLAGHGLKDFISQLPRGMTEYNELLSSFYGSLYERVTLASGKKLYLDKTPRYYFVIDEIHQLFPESKIIILFRNPLAVLASIISSWTKNDWYRLAEFRCDLVNGLNFLLDGVQVLQGRCKCINYENLLASPDDAFKDIFDYLKLEFYPETIRYGKTTADDRWAFGDQDTVYDKDRPDPAHADKWITTLQDPQVWRVMDEYLRFIGNDKFEKLGYEYGKYRAILDKNKPSLDIDKHSVSLWKLTENTGSFLLENKKLHHELKLKNQATKNQDQELILKNRELQAKDQELTLKNQALKVKDQELTSKNQELKDKNQELAVRNQELKGKDRELTLKNQELQEKNQELTLRKQEIRDKDQQLTVRKQELKDKDQKLALQNKELKQLSDQVTLYNQRLMTKLRRWIKYSMQGH